MSTDASALLMIRFISAWRDNLPALFLQLSPCDPFLSTLVPQTQVCETQMSRPNRSDTTFLKTLFFNRVPMDFDGRAWCHAFDSRRQMAKTLALSSSVLHCNPLVSRFTLTASHCFCSESSWGVVRCSVSGLRALHANKASPQPAMSKMSSVGICNLFT